MNTVTAPYNFVPIADKVFFPDAGPAGELQDVPFADGLCGVLTYVIEAQGPLFVRGTEQREGAAQEFFKTPDGAYAIPGSSVRGLIRNVVQIASFGKFGPINDTQYGFRDLQNPALYGKHMAALDNRQKGAAAVIPLVGAGWLERTGTDDADDARDEDVVARITPCSFAKVEYGLLRAYRPGFEPGNKQSAVSKYKAWGGSLEVRVQTRGPIGTDLRPGLGSFSLVDRMDGPTRGTLVFTGQPQKQDPKLPRKGPGGPKHHDFVFYDGGRDPASLQVTRKALRAFEFIHSDSGQQARSRISPNEEWGHWKSQVYDKGGRVPVFYVLDQDRKSLRSFGLAMMFRLAYAHSVGTVADRNQPERLDARPDMAELLFGVVNEDRERSLKGRVSIGLAVAAKGEARPAAEVTALLGSPKPTFYPSYVEQGAEPGSNPPMVGGKPAWKTYMDPDARLRGWKRYRPQQANFKPPLPPQVNEKMKTRFVPLLAGARFAGKIRVHNLRPVELGALLWALDFGGRGELEHMLGMARSLGFGRVKLKVTGHELLPNANRKAPLDDAALEQARAAFVAWATAEAEKAEVPGGWDGSAQMAELLACARPLPEGSREGMHLSLHDPVDRNQFTKAKLDGLALPPAAAWKRPPKASKPPPSIEVRAVLLLNPGTGEWSGQGSLEGRPIKLFGKGIPGISDQQKAKRKTGEVTCVVQPSGGNNYRVLEVKA